MKKLNTIATLLILASALPSCSENGKKDQAETAQAETAISDTSFLDDSTTTVTEDLANTGSENWDKMLDDYDAYVDQYVKLYKKAMVGDGGALAEYPAMLEKANALQESMDKAKEDQQLSAEQLARMMKIQAKMLEAMK